MLNLLTLITYDGKNYEDLIDENEKLKIKNLAIKLSSIEIDIIQHKTAFIDISKNGNIYSIGFPNDIGERITQLLSN